MSGAPAILLQNLSKSYGPHVAVAPTDLSIAHGEFLTLLGPSGCGKSTTLGLIAGFVTPSCGEVFVQGERVTHLPTFLRDVGVVFQDYALFPHMSVFGNVAFGLRLRKVPSAEIARRVDSALAMVRLSGFGTRKPAQLSGGQQQRVALARAIVIRPKILLLDEPLSALDKHLRTEMQVEIREIQRAVGITTILVTHDQGEALSMSDRIAVMQGGVIQQVATPDAIYNAPVNAFVAAFVGEVNRISVTVAERTPQATIVVLPGGKCRAVPSGKVRDLRGDRAELFLRPQGIAFAPGGQGDFTATIGATVFQGSHYDVHLTSGGGALRAAVAREALPAYAAGQDCAFTIADGAISLLCGVAEQAAA
jgi:spermidine/putrescine ABC transporter ATP-binding subunit